MPGDAILAGLMSGSVPALPLVFDPPRRAKPPRHFADLDEAGRAAAVAELGLPAFRGKQLANQYYSRLIADPGLMTDLPAAVREQVSAALFPRLLDAAREIACDAGETRKVLWRAVDGTTFESVLMRYPDRNTVCISSQAGCGMACPFCATGMGGLQRNMSTAEIVEQVVAGARSLARGEVPGGPGRVSNVVFMGMGEPLANYKAVIGTSSLRSSSSGACRLRASVTGMPSSVSWLIRGTRPTVETVMPRALMPSPAGDGSVRRRTALRVAL